jgi:hypothetical protein
MQANRIDGEPLRACDTCAVPEPSSVQGLGLCDAHRFQPQPCRIVGAIEELEARHGPLRASFERARTRWDELAEGDSGPADPRLEQELSRSAYALRVLAKLRGQLPTVAHDAPVWIVGPGSTMTSFVAGAALSAVEDLAELVRQSPKPNPQAQMGCVEPRLRRQHGSRPTSSVTRSSGSTSTPTGTRCNGWRSGG